MKPSAPVRDALARLNRAAGRLRQPFEAIEWRNLSGPGPARIVMPAGGTLPGLRTEPGKPVRLRARLRIPDRIEGVPLAGQPLELTVNALVAIQMAWNGKAVFDEDMPGVAAGPALLTLAPSLRAGEVGRLDLTIGVPPWKFSNWLNLRFTTPAFAAAAERLEVAAAQLSLADAVARTPAERRLVDRAIPCVPQRLLPVDAARLERAFDRMRRILMPLDAPIRQIRVHLIGHSHIDLQWLWPWSDTVEVIRRDVRSVLGLMREFPELTFTHSQAATYDWLRRREPALFREVAARAREGRWEVAAMQWAECDANMPSGESHVRQLLAGVGFCRRELGLEPTAMLAPDTFGHPGNLPQLAASAGARLYYHHRCNPGRDTPWPAYVWRGQDGTPVTGLWTPSYNGGIRADEVSAAAARALAAGHPCALHFHGVGDHGGGPARQHLQALRRLRQLPLLPRLTCSTLAAYARELGRAGVSLPEHAGESRTIFEGCYTTHADAKQANREAENRLADAETLTALAGLDARHALGDAWRRTLLHQFHDTLDGSSIAAPYRVVADDRRAVERACARVSAAALRILQASAPRGQVTVTNPLPFDRTDWVVAPGLRGSGAVRLLDPRGEPTWGQYVAGGGLGFVATVPAFATVSYRIARGGAAPAAVQAVEAFSPLDNRSGTPISERTDAPPYLKIETDLYRAWVRRDCGVIVSLTDLRDGREWVGFGMRRPSDYIDSARPDLALNVLQLTDEHPHGMSSWQLHELHTEHSLLRGATMRVVESGPARVVLEVAHAVRSSTVRQRIAFHRSLPRIDFDTTVDWREVGDKERGVPGLKVAFTARLSGPRAWFETPFAAAERPADGQETPALRWADVGNADGGIAVLNADKHGYDALGSRLRLTLLRSAYDPDPVSDAGTHRIRYALLPHPGDWRQAGVAQAADAFNRPMIARRRAPGPARSAAAVSAPRFEGDAGILVSTLKPAEDGRGVIVRLYDAHGQGGAGQLTGLPSRATVVECSVLEDDGRTLRVARGAARLAFRPWQVRTLRIVENRA